MCKLIWIDSSFKSSEKENSDLFTRASTWPTRELLDKVKKVNSNISKVCEIHLTFMNWGTLFDGI